MSSTTHHPNHSNPSSSSTTTATTTTAAAAAAATGIGTTANPSSSSSTTTTTTAAAAAAATGIGTTANPSTITTPAAAAPSTSSSSSTTIAAAAGIPPTPATITTSTSTTAASSSSNNHYNSHRSTTNHHQQQHPHHHQQQQQQQASVILPNSNSSNTNLNNNNNPNHHHHHHHHQPQQNTNNNQVNSINHNNNPTTTSSRLPELLDCVKQEFDNLQSESSLLKAQSQEFETHIGSCAADLSHLREQLVHLDHEHHKLKLHYEEELRRLHLELEQRSAAGIQHQQPSNQLQHDSRPPPNLPQFSHLTNPTGPPSANSFGNPASSNLNNSHSQNSQNFANSNNSSLQHHDPSSNFAPTPPTNTAISAASNREIDSNYPNGNGPRNSADNTIPDHPSKRLRTERDRTDPDQDPRSGPPPINHNPSMAGMAGSPVLSHPPGRTIESKNKLKPNDSQYSKLPHQNSSHPPYGNSYHSRSESHIPPPPPSHHHPGPPPLPSKGSLSAGSTAGQPMISNSTQPGSLPNPAPNTNVLLDLDPDTLPSNMKKEGVDWLTMFNPKVKKVLDVGLVHTLVHESVVCCVKFSPDGTILATGCNRFTSLYNTRTGAKICQLLDDSLGTKGADNYIRSASFSPDGKLLATGSEDRIIRIWDVAQQRIVNRLQGHKSEIYSLAFSPDGRLLVSGSGDKTARIWDMNQGSCLFHLVIEETVGPDSTPVDAGVTSVCVSPDGSLLAAGSLDTVVRLWDTSNGQLLDKLKGHKDSVYSVAFSPDGKFLVSGSLDRSLKLWDLSTLNRDGNPPINSVVKKEDQNGNPAGLERGENGERVTSDRGFDPTRPTTFCTTTLSGHKDYVLSVAVSSDGDWIMSGSKDRGVQFWDPKTGMAQFMLQGHKNSVISIAVSDTGGLLATGSGDWHARIWSYERIVPKK